MLVPITRQTPTCTSQQNQCGELSRTQGLSKPQPESKYRQEAVQSGKQPSYGGRRQLISDGLHNPEQHLEKVKLLDHPFESLSVFKPDHFRSIGLLASRRVKTNEGRLSILQRLRKERDELISAQKARNEKIAWTAKALEARPDTLLLRKLQNRLDIEDKAVPELLEKGMGIIGDASLSPFFEPFDLPPKMSKTKFYGKMEGRFSDDREGKTYGKIRKAGVDPSLQQDHEGSPRRDHWRRPHASVTLWLKAVSAQTSLISCHNCDWGDNLVFFDPFVFVTFVILVS